MKTYRVSFKDGSHVFVEANRHFDDTDNGRLKFLIDDDLVGDFDSRDISGWHITSDSDRSGSGYPRVA